MRARQVCNGPYRTYEKAPFTPLNVRLEWHSGRGVFYCFSRARSARWPQNAPGARNLFRLGLRSLGEEGSSPPKHQPLIAVRKTHFRLAGCFFLEDRGLRRRLVEDNQPYQRWACERPARGRAACPLAAAERFHARFPEISFGKCSNDASFPLNRGFPRLWYARWKASSLERRCWWADAGRRRWGTRGTE